MYVTRYAVRFKRQVRAYDTIFYKHRTIKTVMQVFMTTYLSIYIILYLCIV